MLQRGPDGAQRGIRSRHGGDIGEGVGAEALAGRLRDCLLRQRIRADESGGELGMALGDGAAHLPELGVDDQLAQSFQGGATHRGDGVLGGGAGEHELAGTRDHVGIGAAERGLLGREVVEEGARRHPGPRGDRVDRDVAEVALVEQLDGGAVQRMAGLALLASTQPFVEGDDGRHDCNIT